MTRLPVCASSPCGQPDRAISPEACSGRRAGVQFRVIALAGAMGGGDETAQVAVALAVFSQQSKVIAAFKGYFGADDALYFQGTGKLGEAHGPAEVIMVGEGQGPVTQLFGPQQQLLQRRGPVMKRIVAVAMKFSVNIQCPIVSQYACSVPSSDLL